MTPSHSYEVPIGTPPTYLPFHTSYQQLRKSQVQFFSYNNTSHPSLFHRQKTDSVEKALLVEPAGPSDDLASSAAEMVAASCGIIFSNTVLQIVSKGLMLPNTQLVFILFRA